MSEAKKSARADYPQEDARIMGCVADIQAALKKHDCTGMISITTEHRMEFVREFAASWSCAWIEKMAEGYALRIKSKDREFPSPEAKKKCIEATIGMFFGFFHQACEDREAMGEVIMMLKDNFPDMDNFIETYKRVAASQPE